VQTLARPWALRAGFALLVGGAATAAVLLLAGRDDEGVSSQGNPPPAHRAEAHFRPVSRGHRPPVLGAAVNWELLRRPGTYQRLFLDHYRSLTPENVMKMDTLAPAPDRLSFGDADALVRWSGRHGIAIHGHTLVWGKQLPPWLTERAWTRDELRSFLEQYVKTVVGRYRGRIGSWDVVNEPLATDGSLKHNFWRRVLGPGYVADALRWAHEADPGARLYVNDFNIEGRSPKTDGMLALLSRLRRERAPIDGIGLQSHLTLSSMPTAAQLRSTMRRYAALGLAVDISEMDVPAGPGRRAEAAQARAYREVAAACHDLPACGRFATWGFTDASTWLGTGERPLPFTARGAAKPAWRAIESALSG
jgi:endo-1,4-beta-xylanase